LVDVHRRRSPRKSTNARWKFQVTALDGTTRVIARLNFFKTPMDGHCRNKGPAGRGRRHGHRIPTPRSLNGKPPERLLRRGFSCRRVPVSVTLAIVRQLHSAISHKHVIGGDIRDDETANQRGRIYAPAQGQGSQLHRRAGHRNWVAPRVRGVSPTLLAISDGAGRVAGHVRPTRSMGIPRVDPGRCPLGRGGKGARWHTGPSPPGQGVSARATATIAARARNTPI